MTEIGRRAVDRPMHATGLVGAEQQPLALLPRIEPGRGLRHVGQLVGQRGDLGDRLGHQVMMLDRHQRQHRAGQRRHLAGPQAGGIDDEIGADGAGGRDDVPLAQPPASDRPHDGDIGSA